MSVRGFGDLNFEYRNDGTPSTFSLGELDIFVTSNLSDSMSVLAETVLEPGETAESSVHVERYQLKYSRADWLMVAVGRMHTSLGYWNQTKHHGKWFQTTATRPLVYRFEDEGGILPVHEVGLKLFGAKGAPGFRVEYDLSVSNSRGPTPENVAVLRDLNHRKAVNLWLGFKPAGVPGLQFGGVARIDAIPALLETPGRAKEIEERILGGFTTFQRGRTEVLAEIIQIRHREKGGMVSHRSMGLYAQASHKFSRATPYYRYDRLEVDDSDPFYRPNTTDLESHTWGARLETGTWSAIKLEFLRSDPERGRPYTSAFAQVAFTF